MKLPLILCLGAFLAEAAAGPADSLAIRLGRIRALVDGIGRELDSLEGRLAAEPAGPPAPVDSGPPPDVKPAEPILGELLTPREKALAAAAGTPFQRLAVGYSFDPLMPLGLHYLAWGGKWGISLAGTARLSHSERQAGGEAILMRGLHRFALFQGLQTHLYAFAGPGLYWRRMEIIPGFAGMPPFPAGSRAWYGTPDIPLRFRLGARSELGLMTLGGVRGAPEIGFQAIRYLSRYQDSETWDRQSRSDPGFEEKPRSDFALGLFLAFHLSFYFL